MERIVCKFGGTSLADAGQFRKVRDIVLSDPRRRIVVPSAPGKRMPGEPKVTDLLLLCHEMASMKTDFSAPFETVRSRFLEIKTELGLSLDLAGRLDAFRSELAAGVSRDYAASRGEHFCGLLLAEFLGAEFVEPADCVIIRPNGDVAPETYPALSGRLAAADKMFVMPGFYGRDLAGNIKVFSRGGSDISGAIAARAAGASLYENWTDVSGLCMADPKIVKNPKLISEVSYREIRELSYMGATVFHDEAIMPVRESGIPINIKNTNRPQDRGTFIVPKLSPEAEKESEIAGIAGKKNFAMLCVEKSLMNKEVGFAYKLLGILESHNISIEHCPTGIDSMNVIIEQEQLGDNVEPIIDEIKRVLLPDSVELERNIALVAVVGEEMNHAIGTAAKIFIALRDAGVNVRVINQGASELNIIVGVASEDYEKAVQALYDAFVRH